MSTVAAALDDYLALRRSLGYKLQRAGRVLATFVAHLEHAGSDHVTIELALTWATSSTAAGPRWQAQQLGMARNFARYLHAIDPRHEIPPAGLLPRGQERLRPWLCSQDELVTLVATAGTLAPPLRAATMQTLIGLLAVTGLRVGEAIRLERDDVDLDQGVLLVDDFKGKSRRLPLHPSTVTALQAYAAQRDRLLTDPPSTAFLISTTGTRLHSSSLGRTFAEVVQRAGLRPSPDHQPTPRLGALRHSFAVHTLQDWHRDELDVERSLPLLSAYLGHASPASTYWYLHASPQLLAAAVERTRRDTVEEVGS